MATNNRLVDYNLRNIKAKDVAFQNFITNIQASANSYNIEALNECYAKLPLEWRNSDKIFVAGAWNVGSILGYDQSGSIINMPFSRASVAWGESKNLDILEFNINEPSLCAWAYKRDGYGLIVENARNSYYRSTDGSGSVNNPALDGFIQPSGFGLNGMANLYEIDGYNYVNTLTNSRPLVYIGTTTLYPDYTAKTHRQVLFDITDCRPDSLIALNGGKNSVTTVYSFFDLQFNRIHSTAQDIKCIKKEFFNLNGRSYALCVFSSNVAFGESMPFSLTRAPKGTAFIGDSNVKLKIGRVRGADSLTELEKSILYASTSVVFKEEDILTINLAQISDIFINTSKGAFTFRNQPIGAFDYKANGIIDCKVYNVAIKHV